MKNAAKSKRRVVQAAALAGAVLAGGGARAAEWRLSGAVEEAQVQGGPWVLNQVASPSNLSTLGSPYDGMCAGTQLASHVGTDLMQPYYFPLTFGSDKVMRGYFDYRVKDREELLTSARSVDGGRTWKITGSALQLNGGLCGNTSVTDNGQGHAAVFTVAGKKHLYTLDRAATPSVLLEHTLTPVGQNPLAGQPAQEPVSGNTIPATAKLVNGLHAPDGILGVVPGYKVAGQPHAVTVLYLAKDKDFYKATDAGACPSDAASKALLAQLGKKPNQDRPVMHLAHTTDGINFTDDGPVSFDKINPADPTMSFTKTRFIGPHGSVIRYANGSYGLFFSGGNCGDGDSDAYHYIGYAHSADAVHWSVDNDITNPLLSVDYAHMNTTDRIRHHYTGRTYSPSVTLAPNGKSATLVFSGYNTPAPLPKPGVALGVPVANDTPTASQPSDYREILRVTLLRDQAPQPEQDDDGGDDE